MNIKLLNLSAVLVFLLFTSSSSVLAMEVDGEITSEKKNNRFFTVINSQQIEKNKQIFDFWALREITTCEGGVFHEDVLSYIRNIAIRNIGFADQFPQFPLNKKRCYVESQPYFISGKSLKNLLIECVTSFDPTKSSEEVLYHGHGIFASNLGKTTYQGLQDNDSYNMIWDCKKELWKINGIIPKAYKIFNVEINKDYADRKVTHYLPEFPINEYGEDIKPQSYSISGDNLKNLLINRKNTADPSKPENEVDYLRFGVSATNLGWVNYQKIKNSDIYDVIYDGDNEWEINGTIPNSNKKFKVEIDPDYAP